MFRIDKQIFILSLTFGGGADSNIEFGGGADSNIEPDAYQPYNLFINLKSWICYKMFITSIHLLLIALIRRYAAFTIVFRSANVLEADCLQLDVVNGQVQIWPKFGGNEKYLLGKMM
jgi:hypothetical protein